MSPPEPAPAAEESMVLPVIVVLMSPLADRRIAPPSPPLELDSISAVVRLIAPFVLVIETLPPLPAPFEKELKSLVVMSPSAERVITPPLPFVEEESSSAWLVLIAPPVLVRVILPPLALPEEVIELVVMSPLAVRAIVPPFPLALLESKVTWLVLIVPPLRVMLPPRVVTGLETVSAPVLLRLKFPLPVDTALEKLRLPLLTRLKLPPLVLMLAGSTNRPLLVKLISPATGVPTDERLPTVIPLRALKLIAPPPL